MWVYASETAEAPAAAILGATGAHIVRVTDHMSGLDLGAVLNDLNTRGVTRLMVEEAHGLQHRSSRPIWSMKSGSICNPMVIGDDGVPALDHLSLDSLTQSPRFVLRATETIGSDHLSIYGHI